MRQLPLKRSYHLRNTCESHSLLVPPALPIYWFTEVSLLVSIIDLDYFNNRTAALKPENQIIIPGPSSLECFSSSSSFSTWAVNLFWRRCIWIFTLINALPHNRIFVTNRDRGEIETPQFQSISPCYETRKPWLQSIWIILELFPITSSSHSNW